MAKKTTEEYDAIINLAGGFEMGGIEDEDIFERYER
jgi:hypothetical protein